MRLWIERVDNRLLRVESDIKEIYDRIVLLEQKPTLQTSELQELEVRVERMADWMRQVIKKTGISFPKL